MRQTFTISDPLGKTTFSTATPADELPAPAKPLAAPGKALEATKHASALLDAVDRLTKAKR